MPSDKEIADQLDAEDRLRNRGFVKKNCPTCNARVKIDQGYCPRCQGKGYIWEAPLERLMR